MLVLWNTFKLLRLAINLRAIYLDNVGASHLLKQLPALVIPVSSFAYTSCLFFPSICVSVNIFHLIYKVYPFWQ